MAYRPIVRIPAHQRRMMTAARSFYVKHRHDRVNRLSRRVLRIEQGKNLELKTHDATYNTQLTTTGVMVPLSEIAQGDTSITRDGLQIQPRSLRIKCGLVHDINNSTTNFTRLIIFCDTQNAGTYPTAVQLLETDSVHSWPEHDSRPRFKIYKDKVYSFQDSGKAITYIKFYKKFGKKFRIWYQGTTAGEVSNGKNALFAYFVDTEGTYGCTPTLQSRLRYCDP